MKTNFRAERLVAVSREEKTRTCCSAVIAGNNLGQSTDQVFWASYDCTETLAQSLRGTNNMVQIALYTPYIELFTGVCCTSAISITAATVRDGDPLHCTKRARFAVSLS